MCYLLTIKKIHLMKISTINGVLTINEKEVLTIVFVDGSTMRFPTDDFEISVENTANENIISVIGNRNITIQGKNVIAAGSSIKCGGDFRLGDG